MKKQTIKPELLSLKEAFSNAARYDPYRIVSGLFERKDYNGLAKILKRQATVREATAIPTVLLHLPNIDYAALIKAMQERGALRELVFCADIARRLALDSKDSLPEGVECLARQYEGNPCAMNDLAPHYKGEFWHFYAVYRHYGNRPAGA